MQFKRNMTIHSLNNTQFKRKMTILSLNNTQFKMFDNTLNKSTDFKLSNVSKSRIQLEDLMYTPIAIFHYGAHISEGHY